MIRALTGFSTRNPWKVIALWAVLGIAMTFLNGALVFRVTGAQPGDFLPAGYDSAAALKVAEERFGVKPDANTVTVLVGRSDGAPLTGADEQHVKAAAEKLGRKRVAMPPQKDAGPKFLLIDHSQTPRVAPAMTAPDRSFQLLSVQLTGNSMDPGLLNVFRAFRADARAEFAEAGLRSGFTGGIASVTDTTDAGETRSKVVGGLTMALIVLLNVLVFRSVLAAFLPLLAITFIGGAAGGAVSGTAMLTGIKLDGSTPSLIGVVLLGIGIDYFLFLLFRYREQLRAQPERNARAVAAEVSGRVGTAITSAALTIVAAFATLGIASFGQFRVLGPAIAVSVLVMLLGSLTLMPAMLAMAGRKMFWPSRALKRAPRPGTAGRLGELVARRPVVMALASVALLGVLATGLAGIAMDYGQGGSGEKTAATETAAEIGRALPADAWEPTTVYVTARDGGAALTTGRLDGLSRDLAAVKGVGRVGPTTLNGDHRAARIDLFLTVDPQTQPARDLVAGPIRATVRAHSPEGTQAHVGGTAAVFVDIADAVDQDLRIVFPVAAALIALILVVLLRSLLAPLILMISVGLGFAATLGASALVFQHLLDKPGVAFTLPLVLFLFVVALGTDYNILISDRIREEMKRPGPARAAVARAVRSTAPAITTAGLVLAGSFGSLAVAPDPGSRQVGFATAVGILLSASVLSLVLVPALAALLGRGTWWPVRPGRTKHRTRSPQATRAAQNPQPAPEPHHVPFP
ncbi:MMPL family transporter [Streptomyces sp. NPDC098789]|uniref:MMPL family transporter n=1 Tax=Streptomyces sp. NPDC098789 TaxID=3366098 RepID=UPI00381E1A28